MIDIQSFNKSLKMKWVQGYLNGFERQSWQMEAFLTPEVKRESIFTTSVNLHEI